MEWAITLPVPPDRREPREEVVVDRVDNGFHLVEFVMYRIEDFIDDSWKAYPWSILLGIICYNVFSSTSCIYH